MKTKSILILSIVFVLCSCGSSRSVSTDRITVSSFDKIISNAGINIYFSESSSNYVEIEKGSGIAVDVKNGTLMFSRRGGFKADVYVYGNNIESVVLSGASKFTANKLKNSKHLSIAASGGSSVLVEKLNTGNSNLAFSGSSNCIIKELKANNVNVAVSGASETDIYIKKASNTNVASSGGSKVAVSGKTNNISVNASGGSNVNISNLKYNNLNERKAGGGAIHK